MGRRTLSHSEPSAAVVVPSTSRPTVPRFQFAGVGTCITAEPAPGSRSASTGVTTRAIHASVGVGAAGPGGDSASASPPPVASTTKATRALARSAATSFLPCRKHLDASARPARLSGGSCLGRERAKAAPRDVVTFDVGGVHHVAAATDTHGAHANLVTDRSRCRQARQLPACLTPAEVGTARTHEDEPLRQAVTDGDLACRSLFLVVS